MNKTQFTKKKRERSSSSLNFDSDKEVEKNNKKDFKNQSFSEEESSEVIIKKKKNKKGKKQKKEKEESDSEKEESYKKSAIKIKTSEATPTKDKSLDDDIIIGDNEISISLNSRKRVTIRKFNRQILVDIREYYEKSGEMLPGKKGISLTIDLWEKIKKHIKNIDTAINGMK